MTPTRKAPPRMHPKTPIFKDVQTCDAGAGHEIALITDGRKFHAYGDRGEAASAVFENANSVIKLHCPEPLASDEPCYGEVTFDLGQELWKSADQVGDPRHLLSRGPVLDVAE